jgi:hypothetical protein
LLDEVGKITAVVDVGVRKNDGVYLSGMKICEVFVQSDALGPLALEETAVEEYSFAVDFE